MNFLGRHGISAAPVFACALLHCLSAQAIPYTFVPLYTLTPPAGFTGGSSVTELLPIDAGGVVGGFSFVNGSGNPDRAVVWNGSGTPTNLNGANAYSEVVGVGGGQQAGYVGTSNNTEHAAIWSGTAAYTDLHPSGGPYSYTNAQGTDGTHQVGYGRFASDNSNHALLWSGSANTLVDLQPASGGYTDTVGNGVGGNQQVGFGYTGGNTSHALLWRGSAASVVDLNPAGYTSSAALSTNGSQQVGQADGHAMLWNGSAASYVDLGTGGYTHAAALFTNGTEQVGFGSSGPYSNTGHALLWQGTNQAIDLSSVVPAGYGVTSAYYIDSAGDIFGIAYSNSYELVEWVSTPEPTGLSLAAVAGVAAMTRRRRLSISVK